MPAILPFSGRRALLAVVLALLNGAAAHAGDSGQQPGGATYDTNGLESTIAQTGSAKFVGAFPLGGFDPKLPHVTYVIFRNRARNSDQVVVIDAVGDFVQRRGAVAHTESWQIGDNVKEIDVEDAHSPVQVEVIPKTVEVLRLKCGPNEPSIVLYSDRRLMIDYPALFSINDRFQLSDLRSVRLEKAFVLGNTQARFVRKDGKEVLVEYANADQAEHAYEELWPALKAMAPHVDCGTERNWKILAAAIGIGVIVLFAMAARKGK
jgi:hypothetical protein